MKKFLLLLLLLVTLCFSQQTPKSKEEPYDPDKLGPNEVACGRASSKKSPPCTCMKHRAEAAEKQLLACQEIIDKKERRACAMKADACSIKPTDMDTIGLWEYDNPNSMPPQCKRSCHKARCECCHT